MPEEHNRVLTDHASDLLLAPTQLAMANLAGEGARGTVASWATSWRTCACGSLALPARRQSRTGSIRGAHVLATIHRAENTDDPDRLAAILGALRRSPSPSFSRLIPAWWGARPRGSVWAVARCWWRNRSGTRTWWPRFEAPLLWSPTAADCRRRRTWERPAPRCAPRPSGSGRWPPAGTGWTRGCRWWTPGRRHPPSGGVPRPVRRRARSPGSGRRPGLRRVSSRPPPTLLRG